MCGICDNLLFSLLLFRVLLQFDTREFLNVLALAFEEPEFTSELGLRRRQLVVDILLHLVVQEEGFSVCNKQVFFCLYFQIF